MRARILLLLLMAPAFAQPAFAVEPNERLADPVLEARARTLSQGLRCLVCRNETIDESAADLAHDVRILLRERLTAGDSDTQAVQAIVNRYGGYVLLRPPVNRDTYVLWFGPPALLALAGGALLLAARRRQAAPPPGLSDAERHRLAAMLEESQS